ncbi:MAG: PhoH family protein [Bacilli bacterium]|jgi:phosphate starvation-inducible PhoH-like protein
MTIITGEAHVIKNLTTSLEEERFLYGNEERHLKILGMEYNVQITQRGGDVFITGEEAALVVVELEQVLRALVELIRSGTEIDEKDVIQAALLGHNQELHYLAQLHNYIIGKTYYGKRVTPKTIRQLWYAKALSNYDIVFGLGPAGTGKTYMAVCHAVTLLKKGNIKKIILTRPAVEAGENLGFLPGDLKDKVDPYLRPLYDALDEMLGKETVEKLIERGIIEIAPLAYMRGRTLEDAYIILDEAQNTTSVQLKMFLTRLGFRSKMVITGDITQVDLHRNIRSGLYVARDYLSTIKEIIFIQLTSKDVSRHPLVQSIIEAYETGEANV